MTTANDVWQLLAELTQAQKETERRFQETDLRFRETDRQIKQVNQQIGKLGNRLGEFVEWQVRPSAVRLFQERGINVHELQADVSVKRDEGGLEIDLLVVNDTEVVLVEVKSKLTQKDVDEHLERLDKFKRLMPRYQKMKALGAVAGMVVTEEVANYAFSQGLFVLSPSGEDMCILNSALYSLFDRCFLKVAHIGD
ncbi:hypothetical protein [Geminocystis sp. GBBB08]|uniref:hypothetical protein n=1 Tax=Geminocystis sp. GBBB08 TaxID=2604140 RepID=UPI0027E2E1F3|nr:hypothetical protein [Geminocystis sp. GBBB08]MBL1209012.1 hypothetical protein [Geminocystis sp. GBBB08]